MKIDKYVQAYRTYIEPMIYRATTISDLEWVEVSARMLTKLMDEDPDVSYPEDERLYQAMIGRIDEQHNLMITIMLREDHDRRSEDSDRS